MNRVGAALTAFSVKSERMDSGGRSGIFSGGFDLCRIGSDFGGGNCATWLASCVFAAWLNLGERFGALWSAANWLCCCARTWLGKDRGDRFRASVTGMSCWLYCCTAWLEAILGELRSSGSFPPPAADWYCCAAARLTELRTGA